MRAIAATALTGTIVLATVGLSAASSIGAATDGLSPEALMSGARLDKTFSGSDARVPDDPDAPIRTGRWDQAPAPVLALLGGPETPTATPPAVSPDMRRVEMAALTPPPSARAMADAVAAPVPIIRSRVALTSVSDQVLAGGPRVQVSTWTGHDATDTGSGLSVPGPARSFAPKPARDSQPFDARQLLLSIAPEPADQRKGRWFLFAAGSGEAFGLNIVRDPARGGWRRSGWSVERLAEFGKAQLGIGWRKGDRQIAVSAAQREIGAYGYKREDTVFGLTFTVSGRPPARARFEQRLPKR